MIGGWNLTAYCMLMCWWTGCCESRLVRCEGGTGLGGELGWDFGDGRGILEMSGGVGEEGGLMGK